MNNVLTKKFVPHLTISEFLDECKVFVDSYSCPLCEGILAESVIDKCGHSFCKECAITLLKETSKCPFTNTELNPPLSLNIIVNSVIEKQKVYCKNKEAGCNWIGKLSERPMHLSNECPKEIVLCENAPNCEVQLPRVEIIAHQQECEFRMLKCEYCEEKIQFRNKEEHEKPCPNIPVDCSNKCGMKVPLSKLNYHIDNECDMTVTECPFGIVGCEFYDLRKVLKVHLQTELERHLRMITNKISNLETMIASQNDNIKTLSNENASLKKELENLNDQVLLSNKNTFNTINQLQLMINQSRLYSIIPISNHNPNFSDIKSEQKIFSIDKSTNRVKKISENVGWFGISSDRIFKDKEDKIIMNMKILNTSGKCIVFGITCSEERGPIQGGFYPLIYDKDCSYMFFCYNGAIYCKGVIVAQFENEKSCNDGDIVTVIVDIKMGVIEFRRNGKLMHDGFPFGKNFNVKKIRACVDMCDCGDEVMFLPS